MARTRKMKTKDTIMIIIIILIFLTVFYWLFTSMRRNNVHESFKDDPKSNKKKDKKKDKKKNNKKDNKKDKNDKKNPVTKSNCNPDCKKDLITDKNNKYYNQFIYEHPCAPNKYCAGDYAITSLDPIKWYNLKKELRMAYELSDNNNQSDKIKKIIKDYKKSHNIDDVSFIYNDKTLHSDWADDLDPYAFLWKDGFYRNTPDPTKSPEMSDCTNNDDCRANICSDDTEDKITYKKCYNPQVYLDVDDYLDSNGNTAPNNLCNMKYVPYKSNGGRYIQIASIKKLEKDINPKENPAYECIQYADDVNKGKNVGLTPTYTVNLKYGVKNSPNNEIYEYIETNTYNKDKYDSYKLKGT